MSERENKRKTADFTLPLTLHDEIMDDFYALFNEGIGEFSYDYIREVFLSKFSSPSKDGARLRREKAIKKWLDTELTNEVTNERLRDTSDDAVRLIFGDISVERFFMKLTEIVHRIVGDAPSLDLSLGGFSGGATTSKKRVDGHPAIKFRDQAHATPKAWEVFFRLIDEGCPWALHMASEWEYVPILGNVLFTVPKTSDIDRVACKEPDLNVFLQKALGDQLRKRLRHVGINLNDQSINGRLALLGSVERKLATLDLSSASDSITYRLVTRVMPDGWVSALSDVRSEWTEIDGKWHLNQMFSSMGNGFTFELESLLFYGICRTTQYFTGVKGTVSVYGDDLIVPCEIVEPLIEALQYCGFKVNPDKSFWSPDDPFRESCGQHWHNGVDVTPMFVRAPIARLTDLILFLNQVALWGARNGGVVDPRVEMFHRKWRTHVPKDYWGGQDPNGFLALVTGDLPRFILRPVVKDRSHSHVGGYLAWLHKTAGRMHQPGVFYPSDSGLRHNSKRFEMLEASVLSEAALTTSFYRRRRSYEEVNTMKPYFAGLSDA